MSDSHGPLPDSQGPDTRSAARSPWRVILRSALRAAGSVIAIVTVYYLLPLQTSMTWVAIALLVAGLVVLIILIVFQVRFILASPFPGLRGVEALATSVPLFLVLFAASYVVMARASGASFGQPLTHTDALYFTVTVFTTVGFGDITAKTEAARILVTFQMIMDIVIIGLAIQAIVGAAKRGLQRRSAQSLPVLMTTDVSSARRYCGGGSAPVSASSVSAVAGVTKSPAVAWPGAG